MNTYVFGIDVDTKAMKADELSRAFEFGGNPEKAFLKNRVPWNKRYGLKRVFPDLNGMIRRVNSQGGRQLGPPPNRTTL